MNIIGGVAALGLMFRGYRPYRYGPCVYFIVPQNMGGINLGMFFIIGSASVSARPHESGHSIQNIIWGVLFPFVIGIPSLVRCQYRNYLITNNPAKFRKLPPYDAIWFEGQATRFGNKYIPKLF